MKNGMTKRFWVLSLTLALALASFLPAALASDLSSMQSGLNGGMPVSAIVVLDGSAKGSDWEIFDNGLHVAQYDQGTTPGATRDDAAKWRRDTTDLTIPVNTYTPTDPNTPWTFSLDDSGAPDGYSIRIKADSVLFQSKTRKIVVCKNAPEGLEKFAGQGRKEEMRISITNDLNEQVSFLVRFSTDSLGVFFGASPDDKVTPIDTGNAGKSTVKTLACGHVEGTYPTLKHVLCQGCKQYMCRTPGVHHRLTCGKHYACLGARDSSDHKTRCPSGKHWLCENCDCAAECKLCGHAAHVGPCPIETCNCGKCPDCGHAAHTGVCPAMDCPCGRCLDCGHAAHTGACPAIDCPCVVE